jgi:RHS repeat-associated protein
LSQSIAVNGAAPTVTSYTYNTANQLTSDGTNTLTYDHNGNLTSDGVNTYSWDRANRLLSMGGSSYTYDGAGNRISQTISANVTQYLLDLQPGLAAVLSDTTGVNINRHLHAPRGIHAQKDSAGNWEHVLQDGLGSVRSVVSNGSVLLESRQYEPYGASFGTTGTNQTAFGFTGEVVDPNGLLFLRARYYRSGLGVFTGLDPWEGVIQRPMSMNGYNWVEGNPSNWTDPSGMQTPSAGCSGRRCPDFLREMVDYIMGSAARGIKGLMQRFTEMLADECLLYNVFRAQPIVRYIPPKCFSPNTINTTWRGHVGAFEDEQRGLDRWISCYETQGQALFLGTGNPSQLCDRNNATYRAALAWSRRNLNPGTIRPTGEPGSFPAPAPVPAPVIVTQPIATPMPTQPPIIATPAPYPAPEPNPPFGRGVNVPPYADCGDFCTMLAVVLIGSICLPALGVLAITAPEIPLGAGAVCTTNPQLCGVSP